MKKKVLIIVIIIVIGIISIIYFNSNNEDYYLKYADKLVDLYNENYDIKGIKKKDLEAFDKFLDKLKHKDETIDITDYFIFEEEYKGSSNNVLKATYANKRCFIKYEDLNLWDNYDKVEEGGVIVQVASCNGYETPLFETMFMPPYNKIVEDPKYDYIIDSYSDSLSGYTFKYKSTYDDSNLTLKLIMENKKIVEVEVSYD